MAITNRNIAADANIDLSKINLAGGQRAMWEDFDETPSSTNIADLYGFDAHVSGGTALVSNTVNSCGALLTTGGAFKSMIFGGGRWSAARGCKLSVRINSLNVATSMFLLMGWTDDAGVTGVDAPTTGTPDMASFMYSSVDSANWRFRSSTGAANTDTQTGIAVSTGVTTVSIELNSTGGIVAKINDDTVGEAIGAVTTGKTDWHPYVRLLGGAAANLVNIDTIAVSESRT